jgi:hypothetical protein
MTAKRRKMRKSEPIVLKQRDMDMQLVSASAKPSVSVARAAVYLGKTQP